MASSDVLMEQAIACQQQGKLLEAESLYWQVLGQQPHNYFAKHNLGIVLLNLGDFKTGPALVRETLMLDRDNPALFESYKQVGLKLYDAGHWEAARDWLEKALAYFPADKEIRMRLERSAPRGYLEPEVYDPVNQSVLMRYSPRESTNYVYTIDIVGTCNLRCPTCPVGNFDDARRSTGFMEVSVFDATLAKILDEAPVKHPDIWLYSWGEPLLHPDLPDFIEKVKSAGCTVHLSSNLNIKQTDKLEAVIKAAPTTLKISVSGFSPQSYETTHAKGHFSLLKENMLHVSAFIKKHQSPTHVWVGQHVYKSNQHEVPETAKLCAELGFSHRPGAAFFQPLEKLAEVIEGHTQDKPILSDLLEMPTDYVARIQAGRSKRFDCELRFNQTVINHDGEVALCCSVYDKPNMLGVSFLDTPREQIERLKYEHSFCSKCYRYGMEYSASDPRDRGEKLFLPPAYLDARENTLTTLLGAYDTFHQANRIVAGYDQADSTGKQAIRAQLEQQNALLRNEGLQDQGVFAERLSERFKSLTQSLLTDAHADADANADTEATNIATRLDALETEQLSLDKLSVRYGEVCNEVHFLRAALGNNIRPRIIHFIKTDTNPANFQLLHFLSLRSALVNNPGYRIVFHSPVAPDNALWKKLEDDIELRIVTPPQQLQGKPLQLVAHQSDVMRIDILLEQGGIYLDWDVVVLRPLDALLEYVSALGVEACVDGYPEVLGVAAIAAQAQSAFLHQWKHAMGTVFTPANYTLHSTQLARKLALRHPEQVNVLPATSFYTPGWTSRDADYLFGDPGVENEMKSKMNVESLLENDFKDCLGIHVFESHANIKPFLNKLSITAIREHNTRFNLLMRPLLADL